MKKLIYIEENFISPSECQKLIELSKLNKEELPANLQKILDEQLLNKSEVIPANNAISEKRLPFEPNNKK